MSWSLSCYEDENNDIEQFKDKTKVEDISFPPNAPLYVPTKFGKLFKKEIGKLTKDEPTRIYYVYLPTNKVTDDKSSVVFLFHGTDETAFDTELLFQNSEASWIELAEKENIILVFGQSTGIKCTDDFHSYYRYLWQPGDPDMIYLDSLIEMVFLEYGKDIDMKKVYACGFSNGGLFISDIIVKFPEIFASCCNYMGGRCKKNFSIESKLKIPLLIITGEYDENRNYCEIAYKDFKYSGYDVTFEMIEKQHHKYLANQTIKIWSFFKMNSK